MDEQLERQGYDLWQQNRLDEWVARLVENQNYTPEAATLIQLARIGIL